MTTLTDTPDETTTTTASGRTPAAKWLHDTGAVFTREFLVIIRDPFTLIFSLLQPLVFLGLFGPLLDGMLQGQSIGGADALQWFLPGVLVMIAIFGTGMVGGNLLYELMTGAYERILAGEYHRRGEPGGPYAEDVSAAAKSYAESAKETFGQATEAAKRVMESFRSGFGQR